MLTISLGVGFIVPMLPIYADTMGASGTVIGLIFGVNPLARSVLQVAFGRLSDRTGMKKLLLIGLMGYALVALGFLFSTRPWQLVAWRFMQGSFGSMVQPIAMAYAGLLTPDGHEGKVMSVFNLSFFAGFAVGPMAGGMLTDLWGATAPFLGMFTFSLFAFSLVLLTVPEQTQTKQGHKKTLTPFSVLLRDVAIQAVVCTRTTLSAARGLFSVLLPLWAGISLGLPATTVGILVSWRAIAEAALQPPFGIVADRVNRYYLALGGVALSPVVLFLMPSARSLSQLVFVIFLLAVAGGMGVPSATALSVQQGRLFGMGSVMGINSTANSLGMFLGSVGSGLVMDLFAIERAFWLMGYVLCVGVVIMGYLAYKSHAPHDAQTKVT